MLDIDDLKARFLNLEFDRKDFVVDPDKALTVARMSGETRPEFTDRNHPDFQATPSTSAARTA